MAKFSPTDAVFSGLREARQRPAAVLVWSAALMVAMAVTSVAVFDIGGDSLVSLFLALQAEHPDPKQIAKLFEDVSPAFMFGGLLMMVFGSVLATAVLRVQLKPGVHPWAGLKLGGDELRMLGATVLVSVATSVIESLVGIGSGSLAAAGVPQFATLIPGLFLILAVQVRLSLTGVVSQTENRISLIRSIRLTKGLFWPMLGAYVLLLAIGLVMFFLIAIAFAALLGAASMAGGGGVNQLFLLMAGKLDQIDPLMMVISILSNMAQVWLGVVVLIAWLHIGVEAYKAADKG
jgi:hypothetical protein